MKKKIFIIGIIFLLGLIPLSGKMAENITYNIVIPTENSNEDSSSIGDPGMEEDYDWNMEKEIDPSEQSTYWAFTELALSYNNKIPFADGKRYGRTGYITLNSGIDNRMLPAEDKPGMDSLGYILWLYRNVHGSYDERLDNPTAMYSESAVTIDELRVGDIGMYYLTPENNHYGVCIGFDNDMAVFSHCSSVPHPLYPGGVNRLTYLAEQTDLYYNGQAPEAFKFFIRPDAEWEREVYE